MPVVNPFDPGVFQQPQGQGQILSPSTVQASIMQSGTPFDILSRFATSEQAKRSDIARQALEAERYKTEQQQLTEAAKAKVAAATLEHTRAKELAKATNKAKIAAARVKAGVKGKDFFSTAANQKLASGVAKTFFPDVNLVEGEGGKIEVVFAKPGDAEKWARMTARAQELAVEAKDTTSPNMASYLLKAREEIMGAPPLVAPAEGAQDFTPGQWRGAPGEAVTTEMETIRTEYRAGRMSKDEATKKLRALEKGGKTLIKDEPKNAG